MQMNMIEIIDLRNALVALNKNLDEGTDKHMAAALRKVYEIDGLIEMLDKKIDKYAESLPKRRTK